MRINIQYKDLFEKAINQVLPELRITQITGITIDSRKVVRGDIFFALKGESTDGHNYIEQAEHAGASIAIVEIDVYVSFAIAQVPSTRKLLNDLATAYR